ncbi:peptidoglycan-binding domain-containing protein [Roseovarius ramblicola]|uniref:Peptidoglycan-binding protein n=1 Tax=Roseovarius ramblicola TaxID=2022336 RepID=A0ABV5HVI6_9RHOB
MVMRCILSVALCLFFAAGPSHAADMALILDTRAGDARRSAVAFDPGAALEEAGFEVVAPDGRGVAPLRAAALNLETRISAGEVARLVILVAGEMAGDGRDSWLLPRGAAPVSRLRVGTAGLSVNALSAIAGAVDGPAVLLLSPETGNAAGAGLRPGLAGFSEVTGVTYATGPRKGIAALLDGPLLVPGASFAEAARAAPEGVSLSGNLSGQSGLMGPGTLSEAQRAEAREDGFWQAVDTLDTVAGYDAYIAAWPEGRYLSQARERRDWLRDAPERAAQSAEAALGLTRAARRDVQRWLSVLGHYERGIDGIFGRGTRGAIAAWQDRAGMASTGYLDGDALARLRADAAARQREIEEKERREQMREERRDRAYWRDTGRGGDEAGLRAYLDRYPEGLFADTARARLAGIEEARRDEADRAARADWRAAREADTAEAYAAFLRDHPESRFAGEARARLDEIEQGRTEQEAIARAREDERIYAGAEVVRVLIERRLAQIGAEPGPVDGRFTEETRDAIRRFQRHRDLPVTGYVSQATAAALMGMR